MSRTLAVVDNDVTHLTARIGTLEDSVKFLLRVVWWGGGACVGFGFGAALLVPKLAKALGLG